MPIPFILAGLGAAATAAATTAATVGAAATTAAATVGVSTSTLAAATKSSKEQGRIEGRNEAKAEFNLQIENLKQQIENNSAYKSSQERDKKAIFMCGVAIAFANTGGTITQKEKKIIESVICGKVGMTSTVREQVNRLYDKVSRFDSKESDFHYMLKQASDSNLVNMKDIVELLILLDKCSPEKSCEYRTNYLQLVRYIA